jgi:hypothetical protein
MALAETRTCDDPPLASELADNWRQNWDLAPIS